MASTDSMGLSLSKAQKVVKDRKPGMLQSIRLHRVRCDELIEETTTALG